ncbi:MAG: methylenetetrahydrofolate reductase, partial [Gammaproteobacteria bacterium]|nr:methylenetetrahydrofolate reductase [Gammaproteobacteria bacterium]
MALAAPRYELIPIRGMFEEAERLPQGATITVTCSPKHGIDRTLEASVELAKRGYVAIPHIASRLVRDESHLESILQTLAQHSMDEVFVVGGDAPAPVGIFDGAVPLLEVMATSALRPARIGVTGYPEGHAEISNEALEAALIAKRPYADYLVTQLCFDPATILQWLVDIHRKGIGLPAWIGLPGVMDPRRLLGISLKIGIG